MLKHLKNPVRSIKLAWLLFQIRSLEIRFDDQTAALAAVETEEDRFRIYMAREGTRSLLVRARARYIATMPPGQRLTFRSA